MVQTWDGEKLILKSWIFLVDHFKNMVHIWPIIIPPPNEVGGGVYWIHLVRLSVRLSVCPSVRPSVCRRHGFRIDFQQRQFQNGRQAAILDFSVSGLYRWQGFRDVSQVCFWISISNFICMLMVVIGKSLLIFSEVTFKMAAWWPYWIFWFPDSNFSLALNINSKLKWHNTYVYVLKPIDFQQH